MIVVLDKLSLSFHVIRFSVISAMSLVSASCFLYRVPAFMKVAQCKTISMYISTRLGFRDVIDVDLLEHRREA